MGTDSNGPTELVRLFTDGACSGNPGPGGWELMGVIEGLASLKRPCQVELVTDSQYVAKGIAEWLPNWKRQGWQRKEKGQLKPVANVDLWQRLDTLLSGHKVRVTHVLGHRGHPENEACDRMAVAAYKALVEDERDRRQSGS
jgi:ribonuclease HI